MAKIITKTVMLKGEKGKDGTSILTLEKTGTSGATDTYTITLTDGSKYSFNVTNGSNIASIEKTSTSGLIDTYTITLNNGDTSTFNVTNGKDYKIATFTTKAEHYPNSITVNSVVTTLNHADISNEINETLPDGYKIATATNATFLYYESEDNYQSDKTSIPQVHHVYVSAVNDGEQELRSYLNSNTKMYGFKFRFMAILERV